MTIDDIKKAIDIEQEKIDGDVYLLRVVSDLNHKNTVAKRLRKRLELIIMLTEPVRN